MDPCDETLAVAWTGRGEIPPRRPAGISLKGKHRATTVVKVEPGQVGAGRSGGVHPDMVGADLAIGGDRCVDAFRNQDPEPIGHDRAAR